MENQPSNRGKRWTTEDEDTMISCIKESISYDVIACQLGRTQVGIACRAKMVAKRMHDAGIPIEEITAATAVDQAALFEYIGSLDTQSGRMNLLYLHYAYVAFLRGIPFDEANNSCAKLKKQIGRISDSEKGKLALWNSKASVIDVDDTVLVDHLAHKLETKTGFKWPFVNTSRVFNGSKGVKYVAAFYDMHADQPLPLYDPQAKLINATEGLFVVNAGPGTGKSTTAIKRALAKMDEGVIIVSYTNVAVKEVYDRLALLSTEVGHKTLKDSYGKNYKIVATTVDSLANRIVPYDASASYDSTIKRATDDYSFYDKLGYYKHFIVDEAQDIDDLRGQLIKTLYAKSGAKSLVIFGDPRQRIHSKNGGWYGELWKDPRYISSTEYGSYDETGEYATTVTEKEIVGTRIGFNISYRFKNRRLLELHNSLSTLRPDLHVELTTRDPLEDCGKITCMNVGSAEAGLIKFARWLRGIHMVPSDVVIVTPSVGASNKTSKKAKRLCAILKDENIKSHTSDEAQQNCNDSVLITTIHSVKGKEFKLVVLYGMDGYPENFSNISNEEVDSLVYVAHTRAKERLMYLYSGAYLPSRGVKLDHVDTVGVSIRPRKKSSEGAMCFPVTDTVHSHDWQTLFETNNYTAHVDAAKLLPTIPADLSGVIEPRLLGTMCGLIVETLMTGSHMSCILKYNVGNVLYVSDKKYDKGVLDGSIVEGVWMVQGLNHGRVALRTTAVNIVREHEVVTLERIVTKDLCDLQWEDWRTLTQIYDLIVSGHANARYDLTVPAGCPFPYDRFKLIVDKLVSTFGYPVKVESSVAYSYIRGAYDIAFEDALVELKVTSSILPAYAQQVLIYNACLPTPKAKCYVYNMLSGELCEVRSDDKVSSWRDLLSAYSVIKNYSSIVTARRNRAGCTNKVLDAYVVVDGPLVYLRDPYKSTLREGAILPETPTIMHYNKNVVVDAVNICGDASLIATLDVYQMHHLGLEG